MRARIAILFSLLACCAIFAPAAVRADGAVNAPVGLAMEVRVGFGGEARLGAWVPVQVDVANDGRDLAGRIEVQFESTGPSGLFGQTPSVYSAPATFPQHSHKRLEVDLPVPPAPSTNRVQVRLVSGEQTVQQRAQQFDAVNSGTLVCGALDQTLGAYDFLGSLDLPGRQARAKVADLSLSDLPGQGALLASLDCLIVGDVNLNAMTSDQKLALSTWVARGGLLIATGGVNWQQSLPALPPALLPVRPAAIGTLPSIAPLDQFAHSTPSGPGPWPIARASLGEGAVVAGDAEAPLLAVRRVGAGTVFFYAMDPTQEPARGWAGNRFLWQYMLSYATTPVSANPYQQSFLSWGQTPITALSALPDLNPPRPLWLVLFLLGYATLLGPLAYLLLRRLDRREWLLVILPVAALVGTGITGRLALGRQGSDVAATEVTLLRADAAPVALARTYVGLFSPRQQAIDLHVPAGALLAPGRRGFGQPGGGSARTPLQISEGADVFAPAVHLDTGVLSTFSVDSETTIGGGIAGTLTADSQVVRGQLRNATGQRISDAALVVGASVYPLGTLNPNDSRTVSMALPSADRPAGDARSGSLAAELYPPAPAGTRAAEDPRRDVLDRLFAGNSYAAGQAVGGAMLIGWLDQSPVQVQVKRARAAVRQLTLLEARLPLAVDAGSTVAIGNGLIEELPFVSLGVTQSQAGRYSVATGGTFGVEYDLPAAGPLAVVSLHLLVAGSFSGGGDLAPGANLGGIAAFDWSRGDWRTLPLVAGDNSYAPAAGLVSPTGQVRLRYSFKPPAGSTASGVDFSQFTLSAARVAS